MKTETTQTTPSKAMPAHTPGPWRVERSDYNPAAPRFLIGKRTNGYKEFTAEAWGDPSHPGGPEFRGSAEANARLIAAAPDLLAALKAAVTYLEANRPKGKVRDIFRQLNQYENDVMQPARAAIARAEGGGV